MTLPPFLTLMIAIALEVTGTVFLQKTEQFTRLFPTIATFLCYAASFYALTLVLRVMPLGIAYAIWSGLGMVLIAIAGVLVFHQRLDMPAVIGLALIIAGVLVINLLSNTTTH